MTFYQYRKSHCGDKTILRPSYIHNGISYTGEMSSLYWIGPLVPWPSMRNWNTTSRKAYKSVMCGGEFWSQQNGTLWSWRQTIFEPMLVYCQVGNVESDFLWNRRQDITLPLNIYRFGWNCVTNLRYILFRPECANFYRLKHIAT